MKDAAWSLQLRGELHQFRRPLVMGVLNATPDSFSDGGEYNSTDKAVARIKKMVNQGADIIDIGGESTRPGAKPVPEKEELQRVIPIIEQAAANHPQTLFSIDTTKYGVAESALEAGVHIINDVSGLQMELDLAKLAAKYSSGYILMHMQGEPDYMQENPQYENVLKDICAFFKKQVKLLENASVSGKSIILDPGIGFGKNLGHNLKILNRLPEFHTLGYPLLIGASRKSMIGKILNDRPVDGRLAGTVAVHYHAMMHGARILRVHDVKEAHDSIRVFQAITQEGKTES